MTTAAPNTLRHGSRLGRRLRLHSRGPCARLPAALASLRPRTMLDTALTEALRSICARRLSRRDFDRPRPRQRRRLPRSAHRRPRNSSISSRRKKPRRPRGLRRLLRLLRLACQPWEHSQPVYRRPWRTRCRTRSPALSSLDAAADSSVCLHVERTRDTGARSPVSGKVPRLLPRPPK